MSRSDESIRKYYKYKAIGSDALIERELVRVTKRRSNAVNEELLPETTPTDAEAVSESLTGLALSGGGIRAGALGLGILQTLHRSGLLPYFDYLSTVSGGGYAGAYLTSAGSRNPKNSDDDSSSATSDDGTVPYGQLKAFHDGEGLSERMQQFIFGGHYLLRTRRFFNRHLMGLLSIWFLTVTGLSTLAALAAYLFRELDQPLARHFLGGLGFRTDISRGFFPVTVLLVLWCICWCISFFRASGNRARAQGRAAAKLVPVTVVTFGICLASLLGNGEFSLEWLSSPNGIDVAGLFSSAEKFFQFALYGVIGVGLLPFLNPLALIRSGARPKSTSDRVVFAIASRVVLYGLPFLLVSWFARENISSWTEHRFVSSELRRAGLRGEIDRTTEQKLPSDGHQETPQDETVSGHRKPEDWKDFVVLTKSEIAQWSDWLPAWAPFWTTLRAEFEEDRKRRLAQVEIAEQKVEAAEANLSAMQAIFQKATENAGNADSQAKQNTLIEEATSQASQVNSSRAEASPENTTSLGQAFAAAARSDSDVAARSAESDAVVQNAVRQKAKVLEITAAANVAAAQTALKIANREFASALEQSRNHRRHLAEFIWEKLNTRIRVIDPAASSPGQVIWLPEVAGDKAEHDPPSGPVTFRSVEDVLRRIHKESVALQNLYSRADQNTEKYAPDAPHLILYRILSLVSFGADSIQETTGNNYLGRFVLRRQRLSLLRNWLADHVSRILETSNLGEEVDWSGLDPKASHLTQAERTRIESLIPLVEQAALMSDRHKSVMQNVDTSLDDASEILLLSKAERRELARLNRSILGTAFPGTLRDPATVFAANVLEFDQAQRWTLFWVCLGFFLLAAFMININATTLHGFYARELANNWIQTDEDADVPLSTVDATDQCLPYHLLSGSVNWIGKRAKAKGDLQRDHFLLSPLYCGCEKTGFVETSRYKDDALGLGDAIAISGAAVAPVQQGNPLVQALLWLANLRLGQWLPNPSHGTFLPTKSRTIVERSPVTPMRLMWRIFQTAERRPFLFVTDGGHHENLGIGPLLKRRCRFILAVDAGEDSDYAFSDLSTLMRWARVKHNVKLQPVDSQIEPVDKVSGGALATTVAGKSEDTSHVRSAIDAWNDLAPETDKRLSPDRLSARHFVVLRIHYPDVEGPSWLVYAKTSLTGDEPVELIRYAESEKNFPHDPTSNQFYAPDTFEAYRQLGEHMVDSMVGQLPSIIAGKMDEHEDRPEASYLGGMLYQIDLAKKTMPLNISAAPPTPDAFELIQQLKDGNDKAELQSRLSKRLSVHPLFVSAILQAALRTKVRLNASLMSFLFPELGPKTSPARSIFTERRLPGRAEAMRTFKPKDGHEPEKVLIENFIELAELLAVIPDDTPAFQHAEQMLEYDAVHQLLTNLRTKIRDRQLKDRINRLPSEAKNATRKRKKTTRRRKPSDTPPVD